MEEKKKDQVPEIGDEELDEASGGSGELESRAYYCAHGSLGQWRTCWQCGHDFWYAPGVDARNLNDPWKHFCSMECRQQYEAKFTSRDG